jgi:hypothetical protein
MQKIQEIEADGYRNRPDLCGGVPGKFRQPVAKVIVLFYACGVS